MNKKKVLVTGMAGFIGFHLTKKLLAEDFQVIGIDNLNRYYDINLKLARLKELGFNQNQVTDISHKKFLSIKKNPNLTFRRINLKERKKLTEIFQTEKPQFVVNLAAQAGVRYSLKNPHVYINSNLVGFVNLLENCRHNDIKHLVFASSSSVYGANKKMPFSVHDNVDHPLSLYAATKKSNELMAHTYAHLFQIPTTGLRFFTVYGPWGRPDMALFLFTEKIINNKPIRVFNYGNMKRDFTYIDDIVEGIYRVLLKIPQGKKDWNGKTPDPASSRAPYRLFNIGNSQPVNLNYFIEIIEKSLGKKARKKLLPLQKGDITETYADISELYKYIGYQPKTNIEEGIKKFIVWYHNYYRKKT